MKAAREVRAAAVLTVLGMDGMRLLTTRDPVEALALQSVAEEVTGLLRERDKALAAEIANAVARLFRR